MASQRDLLWPADTQRLSPLTGTTGTSWELEVLSAIGVTMVISMAHHHLWPLAIVVCPDLAAGLHLSCVIDYLFLPKEIKL